MPITWLGAHVLYWEEGRLGQLARERSGTGTNAHLSGVVVRHRGEYGGGFGSSSQDLKSPGC